MKLAVLFAGAWLTLSGCASICTGGWTKVDTALELTYLGLATVDWQQTQYITRHHDTLYETNQILGKFPPPHAVNNFFALDLLHPLLMCALPPRPRHAIIGAGIVIEGSTVIENKNTGIPIIRW